MLKEAKDKKASEDQTAGSDVKKKEKEDRSKNYSQEEKDGATCSIKAKRKPSLEGSL